MDAVFLLSVSLSIDLRESAIPSITRYQSFLDQVHTSTCSKAEWRKTANSCIFSRILSLCQFCLKSQSRVTPSIIELVDSHRRIRRLLMLISHFQDLAADTQQTFRMSTTDGINSVRLILVSYYLSLWDAQNCLLSHTSNRIYLCLLVLITQAPNCCIRMACEHCIFEHHDRYAEAN